MCFLVKFSDGKKKHGEGGGNTKPWNQKKCVVSSVIFFCRCSPKLFMIKRHCVYIHIYTVFSKALSMGK